MASVIFWAIFFPGILPNCGHKNNKIFAIDFLMTSVFFGREHNKADKKLTFAPSFNSFGT